MLLQAALQEPLNQRFVLVSESCIPLYPPTTIWQQLLSEDKSRIDACKLEGVSPVSAAAAAASHGLLHSIDVHRVSLHTTQEYICVGTPVDFWNLPP